jgi:hypothetical protein
MGHSLPLLCGLSLSKLGIEWNRLPPIIASPMASWNLSTAAEGGPPFQKAPVDWPLYFPKVLFSIGTAFKEQGNMSLIKLLYGSQWCFLASRRYHQLFAMWVFHLRPSIYCRQQLTSSNSPQLWSQPSCSGPPPWGSSLFSYCLHRPGCFQPGISATSLQAFSCVSVVPPFLLPAAGQSDKRFLYQPFETSLCACWGHCWWTSPE